VSAGLLVKTATVLDYIQHRPSLNGPRVAFGITDDDFTPSVTFLDLSEETWVDMGRPNTITVTVEIGDTLNEENDQ
jgi:hypothetical protein